jgi:hypothetical protein
MPKEKRNNLAIYTLAGSILLSSVIVSMNQVNAHTTDSKKIKALQIRVESLEADSVIIYNEFQEYKGSSPSSTGNSGGSNTSGLSNLIACVNYNFERVHFRGFIGSNPIRKQC